MEIKEMGTVMEVDAEGNLINEAGQDKFQENWREAINDFVETVKEHLGDKVLSIYVRGSAAKGTAVDTISDLDTITILDVSKEELKDVDLSWIPLERKKLMEKHPFQEKVEFDFISKEGIGFSDRFVLKTQSTCVHGTDIAEEFEGMSLTKENLMKLRGSMQAKIDATVDAINATEDPEAIKKHLKWVCKRFLRRGILMVAERANVYSRDLYPSYKIFSQYYPEKEAEMRKVLEYALNPVGDKEEALKFIKEFGDWIVEEDNRVF